MACLKMWRYTVFLILFTAVIATFGSFSSFAKPTVHLVPHTHDDVGWLKTVEQYQYGLNNTIQIANVNAIISSVVGGLLMNPERKFTYVEVGFFSRWWAQQTVATQNIVRGLVADGRLQFANGGWCMHDEATAHFLDMIDQTTLGHRWLQHELNIVPRVGWQVDPFGHSATQGAILTARAGLIGTYFARVDYQDYEYRVKTGRRQFWWQASPSLPELQTFAEINLYQTYCSPAFFTWDIVGYWAAAEQNTHTNDIIDDNTSAEFNVPLTLERFKEEARRTLKMTRGEHVMWTMGCDFNYLSSDLWYNNMDKLIKIVNDDGEFTARYSTPYEYTLAKLQEGEQGVAYDTKTGDFFPYASDKHQFWTGYFSSRPALKRLIRKISVYWTAARQVEFFAGVPSGELPMLSDALAIAQHHDAVTGTAKQHVTFDYAKRLVEAYEDDCQGRLRSAFSMEPFVFPNAQHCLLSNVSVCSATAAGLKGDGAKLNVAVWNPSAHSVMNALVQIPVPRKDVVVYGDDVLGYSIFASSVQVDDYRSRNVQWQPYTLGVRLRLNKLAFLTLTTPVPSNCTRVRSRLVVNMQFSQLVEQVSNDALVVRFGSDGLLESVTVRQSGLKVAVKQDWCYYRSNPGDNASFMAGGAYIMRPVANSTCEPITAHPVSIRVIDRTIGIVEQRFGKHLVQRLILRGDVIDVEFTSFGIPIDDGFGRELVARFRTSVDNGDIFYTDSNGREMQRRRVNYRSDFPFNQTEPVAGNYYPLTSLLFINDTQTQFNVFPDAAMGATSLRSGEVLLVVHRRLLHDDFKGVGESLNETAFVTSYAGCVGGDISACGQHYGPPLRVRGTVSFSVLRSGSTVMRRVREQQDEKYFAPLVMYSFSSTPTRKHRNISFAVSLSPSLQLLTMQLLDRETLLLRLGHRYAVGEDPERSLPVGVDLMGLLKDIHWAHVVSIDEMSLTAAEVVAPAVRRVTVRPMDIRTFVYHLQPRSKKGVHK